MEGIDKGIIVRSLSVYDLSTLVVQSPQVGLHIRMVSACFGLMDTSLIASTRILALGKI
jgi:hypothetical protein